MINLTFTGEGQKSSGTWERIKWLLLQSVLADRSSHQVQHNTIFDCCVWLPKAAAIWERTNAGKFSSDIGQQNLQSSEGQGLVWGTPSIAHIEQRFHMYYSTDVLIVKKKRAISLARNSPNIAAAGTGCWAKFR